MNASSLGEANAARKPHHDTPKRQAAWPHSQGVTGEQVDPSQSFNWWALSPDPLSIKVASVLPGPVPTDSLRRSRQRPCCPPIQILSHTSQRSGTTHAGGHFLSLPLPPPSPLARPVFHPFPSLLSWLHGQTPDMRLVFILMICSCKAQYFTSIACVTG